MKHQTLVRLSKKDKDIYARSGSGYDGYGYDGYGYDGKIRLWALRPGNNFRILKSALGP